MHYSIVAHSHLRWDFVWQRPQQILSRLAADHPVLYVEEPVFERGGPSLRLSEPQAGVTRLVPVLPEPVDVDAQCAAILPLLRAALARHPLLAGRFEAPVQWFYSPMTAPQYVGQLGELGVVYDCMDELANFRFAPPDIATREEFLLAKSDVVFTGGRQLHESKSRKHGNVHFYGCGVDAVHFGRARDTETPVAPEIAGLPRPVLGYFGVVDERLDYELIGELARAFPGGSVAMVGPVVKVDADALPRAANLHWLGQRPYEALPSLVKGFDVCLMPFALNEATRYINPTKTLEYMAAGKPIVSTAVPDVVLNFTPIVDVADSRAHFVRLAERALRSPNEEALAHGIGRAARCTWDATVERMMQDIAAAVGNRARLAA